MAQTHQHITWDLFLFLPTNKNTQHRGFHTNHLKICPSQLGFILPQSSGVKQIIKNQLKPSPIEQLESPASCSCDSCTRYFVDKMAIFWSCCSSLSTNQTGVFWKIHPATQPRTLKKTQPATRSETQLNLRHRYQVRSQRQVQQGGKLLPKCNQQRAE